MVTRMIQVLIRVGETTPRLREEVRQAIRSSRVDWVAPDMLVLDSIMTDEELQAALGAFPFAVNFAAY